MLHSGTIGGGENIIIFVHGNSQSLHTWDAVISREELRKYTRIAVDLPGHGLSFWSKEPEKDYSASGFAKHLNEFLLNYSNRKFILVGSSLGSSVIGELNPFPSSCKGAVLIGAMLSTKGVTVKDMLQPGVSSTAGFKGDPSDEEIEYLIDHITDRADQERREHFKTVFRKTDPNMRAYLGQSLQRPPALDKVANLTAAHIPIVVVFGEKEKLVQKSYLESRNLPLWQDRIFTIPDAGHCIELDQPAPLAGLIDAFAGECFK